MNDVRRVNAADLTPLGLFIAVGLIVGGWLLGSQIKATRLADRYVTVKGLVERNVKSDLAIWPLSYTETGDVLAQVYAKSEADKHVIMEFLKEQEIQPNEIELGSIQVVDNQATQYGGPNRPPHRYIITQEITLRSRRVEQIAAAAQKMMQLVQKGIVPSGNGQVTYKFNGLNSIKPDMITEATRTARAAADRFASDSGSNVGSIRQANQGVFSIVAADQGSDTSEPSEYGGGDQGADTSLLKKVRVVTTVQYYLEK